MAQFKDLFTELRRDTGLSQEDFAALFHQSGSTIEESISGYFPSSGLSEREIFILMAVYTYGYSVSDIAKYLQVSRQNINQIKKRAENKIRQKLT